MNEIDYLDLSFKGAIVLFSIVIIFIFWTAPWHEVKRPWKTKEKKEGD